MFEMDPNKPLRDYCFVWFSISEKAIVKNEISTLLCTFAYFLSCSGSWFYLFFSKIWEWVNETHWLILEMAIRWFYSEMEFWSLSRHLAVLAPSSTLMSPWSIFFASYHQRPWGRKYCKGCKKNPGPAARKFCLYKLSEVGNFFNHPE